MQRICDNLSRQLVQLNQINLALVEKSLACSQLVVLGALVTANYDGQGDWYPAKVTRLHSNGNIDVEYEDGDYEEDLTPVMIRTSMRESGGSESVSSESDESDDEAQRQPSGAAAASGCSETILIEANKEWDLAPWFSLHIQKGAVDAKQCERIIAESEAFATGRGGWGKDRHAYHATKDLEIADIPALSEWFKVWMEGVVYPACASLYCLGPNKRIRVDDAFIVKYSMDAQRRYSTTVCTVPYYRSVYAEHTHHTFIMPELTIPSLLHAKLLYTHSLSLHSDMSELSFVLPLNDPSCYRCSACV
jgi:hypothetical protein